MSSFNKRVQLRRVKRSRRYVCNSLLPAVLAAICLVTASAALGQVVPAARANGLSLSVGDTVSFFHLQYGAERLGWIVGVRRFGYQAALGHRRRGPLAHLQSHGRRPGRDVPGRPAVFLECGSRFRIYGKGLVGVGKFTFIDNSAQGTYFVVAPGEGVDFKINRHFQWRLAEFEYQYWPGFPTKALSTAGVSSGIRYTIF